MVESNELVNYEHSIDFSLAFSKAIELFSAQAEKALGVKNRDGNENVNVALRDIELTKAKANSFIDSISNLMGLSHELELMKAEKHRFRRDDELGILNSLMTQCSLQSRSVLRHTEILNRRMDRLYNAIDEMDRNKWSVDGVGSIYEAADDNCIEEELNGVQHALDANIDRTLKVSIALEKIISLERKSGGREYGKRRTVSNSITYIDSLDGRDDRDRDRDSGDDITESLRSGKYKARRLSAAEVLGEEVREIES